MWWMNGLFFVSLRPVKLKNNDNEKDFVFFCSFIGYDSMYR